MTGCVQSCLCVCVCVSVSDVLRQERGVYTDATILFSAEGTRRAVWTQWIHQLGQTHLEPGLGAVDLGSGSVLNLLLLFPLCTSPSAS